MAREFISYRRADSAGYAGRLYEHLTTYLGNNAVFMEVMLLLLAWRRPLKSVTALIWSWVVHFGYAAAYMLFYSLYTEDEITGETVLILAGMSLVISAAVARLSG